MKRVTSAKKVLFGLLIGLAVVVLLIFLGRYLTSIPATEENFTWIETFQILGNGMTQIGIVAIYVILAAGLLTFFSRSRITDIPEYSRFIDEEFQGRGSKSSRREMKRALLCYDRKNYDKAIKKLSALTEQCSNEKEKCSVYTLLGMCYENLQQHEKAIDAYASAANADTSDLSLLEKLAQQQYKAGMHSQAVESWLREAELSGSERPYTDIARVYLDEKDYDNVINYSEKAIEINERCGDAYKLLCLVYYALEDKENCLKNYNLCTTYGKSTDELKEAEKWLGKEKYDPYAEYLN